MFTHNLAHQPKASRSLPAHTQTTCRHASKGMPTPSLRRLIQPSPHIDTQAHQVTHTDTQLYTQLQHVSHIHRCTTDAHMHITHAHTRGTQPTANITHLPMCLPAGDTVCGHLLKKGTCAMMAVFRARPNHCLSLSLSLPFSVSSLCLPASSFLFCVCVRFSPVPSIFPSLAL